MNEWRVDFNAYCVGQRRRKARREWWANHALPIAMWIMLLAWAAFIVLPIWV